MALVFAMPGSLGVRARRRYLRRHAHHLGEGVYLELGMHFQGIENMEIGDGCGFGRNCFLSAQQGTLKLGARVGMNVGVVVIADGGSITLGADVIVGPYVVMRAVNHRYDRVPELRIRDQGYEPGEIKVGNNVWIAAGAMILPGSDIGDHSVIAAGSVVRGSIPPFSVVAGVPGRVVKRIGKGMTVDSHS